MPPPTEVTLHVGQAVAWDPSPLGFAQIESLRRSKVQLVYRCKNGRIRRPIVHVRQLAREPMLLELFNPLGRGVMRRSRTFHFPTCATAQE